MFHHESKTHNGNDNNYDNSDSTTTCTSSRETGDACSTFCVSGSDSLSFCVRALQFLTQSTPRLSAAHRDVSNYHRIHLMISHVRRFIICCSSARLSCNTTQFLLHLRANPDRPCCFYHPKTNDWWCTLLQVDTPTSCLKGPLLQTTRRPPFTSCYSWQSWAPLA